jgi:hypothetical protein
VLKRKKPAFVLEKCFRTRNQEAFLEHLFFFACILQHTSEYVSMHTVNRAECGSWRGRGKVHGSSSGEIGMMIFIASKRDEMFAFFSSSSSNVRNGLAWLRISSLMQDVGA